jgi:enoyl-CoA hydratase/carnithine racemase
MSDDTALAGRINVWIREGIGWIELDNPAKLNAISTDMLRALVEARAGPSRTKHGSTD